ncbi:MAG: hypothetical protein JOZ24_12935, partial [Candidatus Eremiobacteraeota bacterium]|nr:hypothetical protein [Candidatus Eremiobacteraeota bacterium]
MGVLMLLLEFGEMLHVSDAAQRVKAALANVDVRAMWEVLQRSWQASCTSTDVYTAASRVLSGAVTWPLPCKFDLSGLFGVVLLPFMPLLLLISVLWSGLTEKDGATRAVSLVVLGIAVVSTLPFASPRLRYTERGRWLGALITFIAVLVVSPVIAQLIVKFGLLAAGLVITLSS